MLQIKILQVSPLTTNCLVVWDDAGSACAVVDPGFYRPEEEKMVLEYLEKEKLVPEAILLTHGHFDHVWGVASLVRRFGMPVYMHPDDEPIMRLGTGLVPRLKLGKEVEPFAFRSVSDGEEVRAGGCSWQVISTPGHSPGGVCYWCREAGVLLSGDTLFAGSIGRTDHEGGDYDVLIRSVMDKLIGLPGDTDVVPGHGHPTTIGREAMTNPFLIPFNEPDSQWEQDGLELDGI